MGSLTWRHLRKASKDVFVDSAQLLEQTPLKGRRLAWRVAGDVTALLSRSIGVQPPLSSSAYSAVAQWLWAAAQRQVETGAPRIAVYALRNRWWLEWAVFACCRFRLMGYSPILLYSSRELSSTHLRRTEFDFWTLLQGNPAFSLIDIDAFLLEGREQGEQSPDFSLSARISIAYDTGREVTEDRVAMDTLASEMLQSYQSFRRLLGAVQVARLVLPSGIVAHSAALLRAAQDSNTPVATVDTWGLTPGHMIWNLNRPALHFDYRAWLDELGELSQAQLDFVQSFLDFQEHPDASRWAHLRSYQRADVETPLPPATEQLLASGKPVFLLGTNVIGDSATLGRETIFSSQIDWLRETVHWFRQRPELGLVIRVHPGERFGPTPLPLEPVLRPLLEGATNIQLIGPFDPINTYALSRRSVCGLLYVSNLGPDLSARALPVISVGRSVYHGLGLAFEPARQEDYFTLLDAAGRRQLAQSEQMQKVALSVIYVLLRLLSAPGAHVKTPPFRLTLSADLNDELSLYYRALAGELNRSEYLRLDLAALVES